MSVAPALALATLDESEESDESDESDESEESDACASGYDRTAQMMLNRPILMILLRILNTSVSFPCAIFAVPDDSRFPTTNKRTRSGFHEHR